MFFLSTSLSNNAVFYMALVSIPLSINIVVDILYKEPKYLGSVLGKVVSLLALDCALLYIGQLL